MNNLFNEFEQFSCSKKSLKNVIGGDIITSQTESYADCDGVIHSRTRGDNVSLDLKTGLHTDYADWTDWNGIDNGDEGGRDVNHMEASISDPMSLCA